MCVLECDRNGCTKIMCDYYSDIYGYLCYDCREELIQGGFTDISAFLNSPKKKDRYSRHWEEYVKTEFKRR